MTTPFPVQTELHELFVPFKKAAENGKLKSLDSLIGFLQKSVALKLAKSDGEREAFVETPTLRHYKLIQEEAIKRSVQHIRLRPEDVQVLSKYVEEKIQLQTAKDWSFSAGLSFRLMQNFVNISREIEELPRFEVYEPVHSVRLIMLSKPNDVFAALTWIGENSATIAKHPTFRLLLENMQGLPFEHILEYQYEPTMGLAEKLRRHIVFIQERIRQYKPISRADQLAMETCKEVVVFLKDLQLQLLQVSSLREEMDLYFPDFR